MKIDYYSRYLKYKQKYIELKGGAPTYYLYLTLVDDATPGLLYGGTHITIIGGGNDITNLRTISANFNGGETTWTLKKGTGSNLREETVGRHQALCFDSDTLDKFSQHLVSHGFQNVKGPYGNPKPGQSRQPWHIFDSEHKLDQQMTYYKKAFRNWHLTICTKIGNECTWEKIILKSLRRIGFDFDGVIHTNVHVEDKSGSRNPVDHNKRNNRCFKLICDEIRKFVGQGYEIFIITARSSANSREIIRDNLSHCGITPSMIPDSNIYTIGQNSKADLAIHLRLAKFYDDSIKQINDFIRKGESLPSPFELYHALPEQNDTKLVLLN